MGTDSIGPALPVAFIQVDLDGLWAVRRCYGGSGLPEQDDPVYSQSVPALLDLFDQLDIKATFFVVGVDAHVTWKQRHLAAIRDRGHEIALHSMTHDLALGRASIDVIEREVMDGRKALAEALGVEAAGFRAPGYAFSPELLAVLAAQGFRYDSSLLPTRWGWALRWIDRRISRGAEREKTQYGSRAQGRAPLRPYPAEIEGARWGLWEIPVSVTARLRLPFHGAIGYLLGARYVNFTVNSLARGPRFLNYILHGMDLVDGRKWPVTAQGKGRRFFQGSASERLDFFAGILSAIRRRFEIRRTDQWVEAQTFAPSKPEPEAMAIAG